MASDRAHTTSTASAFYPPILCDVLTSVSADWLPNHVLVLLIVIVFTILNPLVVPFSFIYFSSAIGEPSVSLLENRESEPLHCPVVHKNQLMRVYSKWYDQNGTAISIRILRYSLDGFLFAEVKCAESTPVRPSHSPLDRLPGTERFDAPE